MEFNRVFTEKVFVICVGLLLIAIGAGAQTFSEWFRQKRTRMKYLRLQVAALTVIEKVVEDGYDEAATGVGVVKFIRDKEYAQYFRFFDDLVKVNPVLSRNDQVYKCLQSEAELVKKIAEWLDRMLDRDLITPTEAGIAVEHIENITHALIACRMRMILLTTPDFYTMDDGERMRMMRGLCNEVIAQYETTYRKMMGLDIYIEMRRKAESENDLLKISLQ